MRVGIDATSWNNRRGFGRFLRNVVGRLIDVDQDTTYVLFLEEPDSAAPDLPDGAQLRPVRVSGSVSSSGGRPVTDLVRLSRAVRGREFDAFVFPSLYTYFPVANVPTVVGLHDAIADELPHLALGGLRARVLWRAKQALAIRRASSLFTVSAASRRTLSERLAVAPESLAIVPEAPDPVFYPRSAEQNAQALSALGLDSARPLFVFAAGVSPHKNIETLLEAVAKVRHKALETSPSERKLVPQLLLAGELSSASYPSSAVSVSNRIAQLELEDSVVTPGFVSDETLARLYSAATAAVVPSLAEGFGLPAVEAAACGSAVVLSDLPAHRETLNGGALYFPARDSDALAAHLQRLIDDPALTQSLRDRARETVGQLTWDTSARRLADVIANASR